MIDCTGDADVAARAGVSFEMGRPGDGLCQPMTLMFQLGGVDFERVNRFRWHEYPRKYPGEGIVGTGELCTTEFFDFRVPSGNRLEALHGDRQGQHSIRINQQYRICFRWDAGHVFDVGIVDYH